MVVNVCCSSIKFARTCSQVLKQTFDEWLQITDLLVPPSIEQGLSVACLDSSTGQLLATQVTSVGRLQVAPHPDSPCNRRDDPHLCVRKGEP